MLESIFESIFELIFKIIFNSIGAAIRWLFLLGNYSYSHLFAHFTKNIIITILFLIMIIVSVIYVNENDKKELQKQEVTIYIKK